MNEIEIGREFDKQDNPVEAASAYEKAILLAESDLSAYIDLAVLYIVCCDFGYIEFHDLPKEFVDNAGNRVSQILAEAEMKFGLDSEIEFWLKYFKYNVIGDDIPYSEFERIAKAGNSLVPYFYLYSASGGNKYQKEAEQLVQLVKDASTAKNRYIKSVLESTMSKRSRR